MKKPLTEGKMRGQDKDFSDTRKSIAPPPSPTPSDSIENLKFDSWVLKKIIVHQDKPNEIRYATGFNGTKLIFATTNKEQAKVYNAREAMKHYRNSSLRELNDGYLTVEHSKCQFVTIDTNEYYKYENSYLGIDRDEE